MGKLSEFGGSGRHTVRIVSGWEHGGTAGMVGSRKMGRVEGPGVGAMWTGRAREEVAWKTLGQETGGGRTHDRETQSKEHVVRGLAALALPG